MKYNYDEEGVAFYYFVLAVLIVVVGWSSIRQLMDRIKAFKMKHRKSYQCSCNKCIYKKKCIDQLNKEKKYDSKIFFWIPLGWLLIALITWRVWGVESAHRAWDPFDVLGISSSANEIDIKKVFRSLSRKFHPDKVSESDRESSNQKFLEIQKAYKALTDEVARKNWEEYGNPDGPKGFSMGIALPAWLVASRYSILVLLLYIVAFGCAIPWIVSKYWKKSARYTRDRILHETMAIFYHELKINTNYKKLFELLCLAKEFEQDIIWKIDEKDYLNLIKLLEENQKIINGGEKYEVLKRLSGNSGSLKAHALLYAHFNRIVLPEEYLHDQAVVIEKSIWLIHGLLQIAIARQWLQMSFTCLVLSQFIISASWGEYHNSIIQLPFIDYEMEKQFGSGKKPIKTINDLIQMKSEDRRTLLKNLDNLQYESLIKVAETFPQVSIESIKAVASDDGKITSGSVVNLVINVQAVILGNNNNTFSNEASSSHKIMNNEKNDESLSEAVAETFEFDEDGNLQENAKTSSPNSSVEDSLLPIHCPYFPTVSNYSLYLSICFRREKQLGGSLYQILMIQI